MKKVKIIQKFLSNSAAMCEATYQRSKAKKDGVMVTKVEIVCAYKLYQVNGWFKNNPFKKLGLPMVDCFMVIVHYSANFCTPVAANTIRKSIVKAVKNNTVSSSFYIVKSIPTYTTDGMSILTSDNKMSFSAGMKYKHLTTCSMGKNKMTLAIHPLNMQYRISA